jgi:hypothetical protein
VSDDMLARLETYYDTAPRASATPEEVGPFTLFVKTAPDGFDYYARPRLGLTGDITASDVDAVRARQRQLGVPENLEWVHDTSPSLLDAARSSGLAVQEAPLLVLGAPAAVPPRTRRPRPRAGRRRPRPGARGGARRLRR